MLDAVEEDLNQSLQAWYERAYLLLALEGTEALAASPMPEEGFGESWHTSGHEERAMTARYRASLDHA